MVRKKFPRQQLLLIVVGILMASILGTVWYGFSKLPNRKKHAAAVGSVGISRNSLETETQTTLKFHQAAGNKTVDENLIRSDTLNSLIEQELVSQYAQDHSLTIEESEVEAYYNQLISRTASETEYLAKIEELYGENKTDHLEQIKRELLREKVQTAVGVPLGEWLTTQKEKQNITVFE